MNTIIAFFIFFKRGIYLPSSMADSFSNPFIFWYYYLNLKLKIIGVKKCHEIKEIIVKRMHLSY